MKDPRTRKQPTANCGLGNIACQLDASSEDCSDAFDLKQRCWTDRCVCQSTARAIREQTSPNCAFTPQAARASKWPEVIHFQCEPAASSGESGAARFGR